MQNLSKQTKKPQLINKTPLARATGQPHASTATSKRKENNPQRQQGSDEHFATKTSTFKRLWLWVLVPMAWVSNQSCCCSICDFVTWFQSRAHDRGSRKGLLPAGTPTSKASLQAFCIQYCWSSAAAWETCVKEKQKQIQRGNWFIHKHLLGISSLGDIIKRSQRAAKWVLGF